MEQKTENNIRQYVDKLFEDAPQTQKAYELKVELTQNLLDKYYTLLSEGKNEEEAYNLTIMSIGNIQELFDGLEDNVSTPYTYPSNVPPVKRSATLVSVAVMMYILCIIPIIIVSALNLSTVFQILSVIFTLAIFALATGLLVYNAMTRPKKNPVDPSTMVGDFKEWKAKDQNTKNLLKTINAAYWPLVVAIYFIVSFATGAWYITWIIYLIAPSVFMIIKTFLKS